MRDISKNLVVLLEASTLFDPTALEDLAFYSEITTPNEQRLPSTNKLSRKKFEASATPIKQIRPSIVLFAKNRHPIQPLPASVKRNEVGEISQQLLRRELERMNNETQQLKQAGSEKNRQKAAIFISKEQYKLLKTARDRANNVLATLKKAVVLKANNTTKVNINKQLSLQKIRQQITLILYPADKELLTHKVIKKLAKSNKKLIKNTVPKDDYLEESPQNKLSNRPYSIALNIKIAFFKINHLPENIKLFSQTLFNKFKVTIRRLRSKPVVGDDRPAAQEVLFTDVEVKRAQEAFDKIVPLLRFSAFFTIPSSAPQLDSITPGSRENRTKQDRNDQLNDSVPMMNSIMNLIGFFKPTTITPVVPHRSTPNASPVLTQIGDKAVVSILSN
jgi:hypothetical protein